MLFCIHDGFQKAVAMRLNLFTDYCLRTLIYLGTHTDVVTRAEIAKAYGISDNHLMKVVHWLAQHGYIDSMRGKGGGIRLNRPAGQINIGELVRASEAGTWLVECFEPEQERCRIEPACQLKYVLREALQAMYAVLDGYHLSDLVQAPGALVALLEPAL